MSEKKGFLSWVSENPVTAVVILLIALGALAVLVGYKDGFMAILGGLLNWIRGGDSENKQKLEEAKKNSDLYFSHVNNTIHNIREQQTLNDMEVLEDVQNAKAEFDTYDIDELIDIGNSMLANHGSFRS